MQQLVWAKGPRARVPCWQECGVWRMGSDWNPYSKGLLADAGVGLCQQVL